MGKSIVLRKIMKAESILNQMQDVYSETDFIERFINVYPDDWARIKSKYQKQEQSRRKREYPVLEPKEYLHCIYEKVLKTKGIP